uniref:Uncharacterized protein n=1 Tax=Arundo donax TaxID=35708 RepID=A0A0A8YYS5_ARUDO
MEDINDATAILESFTPARMAPVGTGGSALQRGLMRGPP